MFGLSIVLGVLAFVAIYVVPKWVIQYESESDKALRAVFRRSGYALAALSFFAFAASTAVYVKSGTSSIVITKFGRDVPPGKIIAGPGEKGPQSYVLPDGWHFWYWPFMYDIETVENMYIPTGSVGLVIARDGAPLTNGETYAKEWSSPQDMLDGEKFMKSGSKGPQLTVLPPGVWRYNPKLFEISIKAAITVKVGEVVVVKANAGPEYKGDDLELVNGTPLVPSGFRGTWRKALGPGMYYMHPEAYEFIHVKTTNRVYSYTNATNESKSKEDRPGDNHSINVRTKDAFEFPIDVRAALKISADDAPYVTARIGSPDEDANSDGFDTLEDIIVLPTVRAVFRNGSEVHGALEYVNMRSTIEKQASQLVADELKNYRVDVDGIYIADIGLSSTEQGKELLKTQTDREVARQEQETWLLKKAAAESRAQSVRADTQASQEKQQVEAEVAIKVAHSKAEATIAEAEGEAKAATMKIEALGGQRNYLLMQAVEMLSKQIVPGALPHTVVIGGEKDLDTAVLARFLESLEKSAQVDSKPLTSGE